MKVSASTIRGAVSLVTAKIFINDGKYEAWTQTFIKSLTDAFKVYKYQFKGVWQDPVTLGGQVIHKLIIRDAKSVFWTLHFAETDTGYEFVRAMNFMGSDVAVAKGVKTMGAKVVDTGNDLIEALMLKSFAATDVMQRQLNKRMPNIPAGYFFGGYEADLALRQFGLIWKPEVVSVYRGAQGPEYYAQFRFGFVKNGSGEFLTDAQMTSILGKDKVANLFGTSVMARGGFSNGQYEAVQAYMRKAFGDMLYSAIRGDTKTKDGVFEMIFLINPDAFRVV